MKTKIYEYKRALALIGVATAILVVALQMSQAQNRWTEKIENPVEGTKGRNAMVGAATGGILGGIAAFVIGGVGVVAMGTGVGAPAGIGLIALAATVGAGGGALVGAATGTSEGVNTTYIQNASPAYESWQWMLLLIISLAIYGFAVHDMRKTKQTLEIQK